MIPVFKTWPDMAEFFAKVPEDVDDDNLYLLAEASRDLLEDLAYYQKTLDRYKHLMRSNGYDVDV